MNEQLSDYSSAYRIIGDEFVPISDDEQFKEIERALEVPLKPVKEHLKKALHFLKGPSLTAALDSIRESIHAVESMCKILTKEENDSLGQALKKLKGKMSIPKDLEESLHKLYGFTSNAQGVRHAVFDEPNLTLREARFMLVACSAFVTYLWDTAIACGLPT
jgi:Hpt domain